MWAEQETFCAESACKDSSAISKVQLPLTVSNDAIGTQAPITVAFSLSLESDSSYSFTLVNATARTMEYGATSSTGSETLLSYNTVSQSPLSIVATLPTSRTRAAHYVAINLERLPASASATPRTETVSYSFAVSVNNRQSSAQYLYTTKVDTISVSPYQAASENPDTANNGTDGTIEYFAYNVGYKQPVMVGLGVLIFLLFLLLVGGVCSMLWMLNRPPAAKEPENLASEQPLSAPQA